VRLNPLKTHSRALVAPHENYSGNSYLPRGLSKYSHIKVSHLIGVLVPVLKIESPMRLFFSRRSAPACESISLPANVAQSEFHQIRHYDLHNVVRGNTYPTLRLSTIERAK
jgi:hypothetical protein